MVLTIPDVETRPLRDSAIVDSWLNMLKRKVYTIHLRCSGSHEKPQRCLDTVAHAAAVQGAI
jgi:hypothetical protein